MFVSSGQYNDANEIHISLQMLANGKPVRVQYRLRKGAHGSGEKPWPEWNPKSRHLMGSTPLETFQKIDSFKARINILCKWSEANEAESLIRPNVVGHKKGGREVHEAGLKPFWQVNESPEAVPSFARLFFTRMPCGHMIRGRLEPRKSPENNFFFYIQGDYGSSPKTTLLLKPFLTNAIDGLNPISNIPG
uniref:SH2 domain-containing protein n=1 Tax=Bursaphelenchus xylophilus TaxID=6326 RepID=A0A1I7RY56_BURXY